MNRITRLLILALCFLSIKAQASMAPKDIVYSFGQYMSNWCNTNDITYRKKIEELCSGKKSCRVEDKIHADYQRQRGFTGNYETYVLDSYLNMFQTLMSSGVRFSLSNIVVETQDKYPDGQTLTFITADIKVSGKINHSARDLFLVRDDKISGIYTYSSQYGFKHLNGSLIAEMERGEYNYTKGFHNGYAVIGYNEERGYKKGLIDNKGNIIIACAWKNIEYKSNATAEPQKLISFYNTRAWDADYIDLRTRKIVPFDYCDKSFSDGLVVVGKGASENRKYGYLNENDLAYNKVQFLYDSASPFHNGLARVEVNGVKMIIDKNFRVLLKDNHNFTINKYNLYFNKNRIEVKSRDSGKYGVVNSNGESVIPCMYDYIERIEEGLYKVTYKEKYGIINTHGDIIVEPKYNEFITYEYGLLRVLKEIDGKDHYEFIDLNGNVIIPLNTDIEYSQIFETHLDGERILYIIATKNINGIEHETLIGVDGRILPGFSWKFDWIHRVTDETGLMAMSINGKCGFVNIKGDIIVPPVYDYAATSKRGHYATVAKIINQERRYGCVDENGTLVIPCIYDEEFEFDNGIALVKKDGKIGLIDVYGNSYFFK